MLNLPLDVNEDWMPQPIQADVIAARDGEADIEAEKANIGQWLTTIDEDLTHFKKDFERMTEDIDWGNGRQWPGQVENDDRYVANITKKIVRQRVASLYAKNPTIVAKRRETMDFEYWDETYESWQAAMQNPADPFNQRLLADIAQGQQRRAMIQKMGKTLEITIKNQIAEQQPRFKRQMKRLVRRVEMTGVGYIKLDFLREMDVRPDIEARIADISNRMSQVQYLMSEMVENTDEYSRSGAMKEQLRVALESLQQQKYILKKEGIVCRFPGSRNIIPSKHTTQLEGWVGAGHVTELFSLPEKEIERIYKVDVSASSPWVRSDMKNQWTLSSTMVSPGGVSKPGYRDVFMVHDIETGTCFTICRGHDRYLVPPAAPAIKTEQFYPIFALTFNDSEDDKSIFPESTVRAIRHQQKEFNRSKESLRQHRIASAPLYAAGPGSFDDEDQRNLKNRAPHDIVILNNLQPGQSVDQLFQMVRKHGIDQNVYETNSTFDDITKIIGFQPAGIGAIAGGTATETSVAQDSHQSDIGSNIDDQDDFLSIVFKEMGHNALMLLSPETVRKIAGRGAVWPELSADEIMGDLYLDIEAGSSGRPNRAAEGATLQRLAPIVLQSPGFKPSWWARKLGKALDENVDLTEMYLEGIPSMVQMNQMAQAATGNPETEPSAQGAAGAMNSPGQVKPQQPSLPGMPGAGGVESEQQRAGGIIGKLMGAMGR